MRVVEVSIVSAAIRHEISIQVENDVLISAIETIRKVMMRVFCDVI